MTKQKQDKKSRIKVRPLCRRAAGELRSRARRVAPGPQASASRRLQP
jgi:hypothetical protein